MSTHTEFMRTGIVPVGYAATVQMTIKVYIRNGESRDIIVTDKIVLQKHGVSLYKKYRRNQWELFPINAVPVITCRPGREPEIKLYDFRQATQNGKGRIIMNDHPKEKTLPTNNGLLKSQRLEAKKKALRELWCSLERVRAKTSGDPQLDKQLIGLFGVWDRPMSKHWDEPIECQQRTSKKPAKTKAKEPEDEFACVDKGPYPFIEKVVKMHFKEPKK